MADKILKLNAKKTVYGTGTGKFYSKDVAFKVHPQLAEKLIKTGVATEKEPKVEKPAEK